MAAVNRRLHSSPRFWQLNRATMVADVFLSLHFLNQLTKRNLQGLGDASHVHEANVSRAPFDIANVSPVDICKFCESLLGNGTLLAKLPNSLSERELSVALLW